MKKFAPLYVELTPDEIEFAKNIGDTRASESRRMGLVDKNTSGKSGLFLDLIGAAGELAFCKGMNLEWSASINTFKLPDVGHDIQVRTAPCNAAYPPDDFGNLILKQNDNPSHKFVLVVGNPPHFVIKGWILGRFGMIPRWLNNDARPPSWFVPYKKLNTGIWLLSCQGK